MIVKMKKITLLVSKKYVGSALHELRKLGLMHIEHIQKPTAHYIGEIEHKILDLDKALDIVDSYSKTSSDLERGEALSCVKEIIGLEKEKQRLADRLKELRIRSGWVKDLGWARSSSLAELEQVGVFIKLYACDKRTFKKLSAEKLVYAIKRKEGKVYFAYIAASGQETLDFKQLDIPHENMYSLNRKIFSTSRDLEGINKKLREISSYKKSLLEYKKELLKGLEFSKVKFGMVYGEDICCLQGFCPKESASEVIRVSKKEGWGIVVEEPDDLKKTPTLIRNPRWIKIIEPVFKFMETIPGYKEYDISFWFLIFFSIFFAMLIGDAGYGTIFFLMTFFIKKKYKQAPKEPFLLMYVLSTATIIWGAITGTWFGVEKIAQMPFFNYFIIDKINTFVATNQMFLIYLCFLIGTIHLTVAHGIVAFRLINSLAAFSHVGWIAILWGMFFLAGNLVLGNPFPDFAKNLLLGGLSLVILFSNPQKNMIKGIAVSLANLPLKLISCFGDILSYMRLFAVGYASAMVAVSCNQMAQGVGFSNLIGSLGSALILFFGHAINIVLGVLSVLVHGIRLNMLEFSGHLDMEWSGNKYKPFKE